MRSSQNHKIFMQRAIDLALKAGPKTLPNPRVGAVVVKKGQIIAEGWHRRFGGKHAEVLALNKAKEQAAGATLYCTLEPCSHYGKQPPCVEAIIQSKVKKVVIGNRDPHPVVDSLKKLKKVGIEVVSGVLKENCRQINPGFFKRWEEEMPNFHLKVASSLDGKMSLPNGQSQWITSEQSRRQVHALRSASQVVLTGVETILKDDSQLNARYRHHHQPIRLIVDSQLRTPERAKIFKSKGGAVHLVTTNLSSSKKRKRLERQGAQIHVIAQDSAKKCDLNELADLCLAQGWYEILVEAGPTLSSEFLHQGLISEVSWFQAAKILGGGLSLESFTFSQMSEVFQLKKISHQSIGDDLLWHGHLD